MKPVSDWQISDIIDLEVFLAEDAERDEKARASQDRELFLDQVEPSLTPKRSGRRQKIRLWLEARRALRRDAETAAAHRETPGDYFRQAYRSLLTILAFAGLIIGSGLAISHLVYYGDKPINVLVFFASTALIQIVILLLLIAGLLFHRSLEAFEGFALIRWLIGSLFLWIARRKEVALGGDARLRFRSALGLIQAKRSTYGSIVLWPLFLATQTFAIFFNLGILATIFLLVLVSNRAFGWESTLFCQSPASFYFWVKIVALPWSWLVPNAYPTLQQVTESQIALHGPGSYSIGALASWWPFLFYAVLFYGLIPRLALWLVCWWEEKRALAAVSFDRPDCSQLLRRMEPVILSGEHGPSLEIAEEAPESHPASHTNGDRCVAIVSRDIDLPQESLDGCLRRLGWALSRRFEGEIDNADASGDLFGAVASLPRNGAAPKLVVVAGETQDPIKAVLKFLASLRAATGGETEIVMLLMPGGDASGDRLTIWKRVLNGLGDPFLSVERAEP